MIVSKKYLLLFSFILALYAFALNEYNNHLIRVENPKNEILNARSLIYNKTVYSIDNVWYVSQIKNYLQGNGFTVNPKKYNYTVRRTPVYPLFYGLHYIAFGEESSCFYIRFSQILIYILATIALFYAAFNFTNSKKVALIAAVLYGFNPSLVSFLYYTITEALSPSLVCFLLYFLSLCKKYNRKKDWILAGLFFAIGSLCRPTIFFSSVGILFFILYANRKSFRNILMSGLLFAVGAGIFFVPHTVRNYIVTKGDFILLEKYYGDPMEYGMSNIELRKWIACWMNPADYSSEVISNNMILAICCDSSKTKEMVLESEMQRLPDRALLANTKDDIRNAYAALYDFYKEKDLKISKARTDSLEKICLQKIIPLQNEFIKKAPLQYYFVTPILFVKSVIMQSNSAQLVFLDNYKGNYLKVGLKLLLYLLNIYLFVALIGCLFFIKRHVEVYEIVLLFMLINFLYIMFVIKYFEVRYLIPLFPGMYVLGAIFLMEIIHRLKQRLHF